MGLELVLSESFLELLLEGRFKLASLDLLPAVRLLLATVGRLLTDDVASREFVEPRFSLIFSEFFFGRAIATRLDCLFNIRSGTLFDCSGSLGRYTGKDLTLRESVVAKRVLSAEETSFKGIRLIS